MGLQALTSSINPVLLSDAKSALRIVNDLSATTSSDDAALSVFVSAAFEHIERETRQQLCTRQYLMTLDGFPGQREYIPQSFPFERFKPDRYIRVLRPPLRSVQSIIYIDPQGNQQTLSPTAYTVDSVSMPGRIVLNPGQFWPQTSDTANAVQITFTAGYGPDGTAVPVLLKQAILLLAGDWYEFRENTQALRGMTSVPIGVQAIINNSMFPETEG